MFLGSIKLAFQRLLSIFFSSNVSSTRLELAEDQTRNVLEYLKSGQWALLRQQLVVPLRWMLSESLLETGWRTILGTTGSLQSTGRPVMTKRWFTTCALVPLHFRNTKLALSLRMTPSGRLFGLRLVPHTSRPWVAPSYAAKNAKQVNLTLGRGIRKVSAVLTLPAEEDESKTTPCIILIGGSGSVDKDSSVGALKPFRDLALGLAEHGIAVCRFDKVTSTLLGKMTMRNKTASLTNEYIHHALDAVRKARSHPNIDANRVVLLGHSLGAVIAARLVSTELSVAGCILMASPAEPLYQAAIRQMRYLASLDDDKEGPEAVTSTPNPALESLKRQARVADSPTLSMSTPASELPFGIGPAYWLEYRAFNPLATLQGVEKPVLILQGGRDYQTTVKDDYTPLRSKFEDRANFGFHVYEDLNHLFVRGQGVPSPLEYENPGNVDPEVVLDIAQWVKQIC